MPADLTRMALRGLALTKKERDEKLAKASPAAQQQLNSEFDAILWLCAMYLVWNEQGVWPEVLAYVQATVTADVEAA